MRKGFLTRIERFGRMTFHELFRNDAPCAVKVRLILAPALQVSRHDQPMCGNETMDHSDNRSLITLTPAKARSSDSLSRDIRVPAPFLVQMAASHAGIGPYRTHFREEPALALARYRATEVLDRYRG
jgi:hypothetical protein